MTFEYPADVVYERVAQTRRTHEQVRELEEHIATDHEVLRRLWEMHQPIQFQNGVSWCQEDGSVWPCATRCVLMGEK